MAFPKWLTTAGDLGTIPELAYYEFDLDAYDENLFSFTGNLLSESKTIRGVSNLDALVKGQSITGSGIPPGTKIVTWNKWANLRPQGNTITISANAIATINFNQLSSIPIRYTRVSGVLPEGIQIIEAGKLVGIPITTAGIGDLNEKNTFSIRATNLSTGNISDRTFSITVTNVAPPIITPKSIVETTKLQLGNTLTANVGDYLTQNISGANARVLSGIINSTTVTVSYVAGSPNYILGSGNLRVVSSNIATYPSQNSSAFPTTATTVSSISQRNLGIYLDGAVVDLQLEAIEFANSSSLSWQVTSDVGSLPDGLILSEKGLLSGYLLPIPAIGPSSTPGWSVTPWNLLPWDFNQGSTKKNFIFTVEVTDGVNYDSCTYSMMVFPRNYLLADSTLLTVDTSQVNGGTLSVDTLNKHYPLILNNSKQIPDQRSGSFLSFKIEAIDLDSDTLVYSIPDLSQGAFDEQQLLSNSIPYIASTLTDGNLYSGVFPKVSNTFNEIILGLFAGNIITANVGDYITQSYSNANARVSGNVVAAGQVTVDMIGTNSFYPNWGNLYLNGNQLIKSVFNNSRGTWSNVGIVPDTISGGYDEVVDNTTPALLNGDVIQVLNYVPALSTHEWIQGTVTQHSNIRLRGNTVIQPTIGQYLTQPISGANAIITGNSNSTGTINLFGATVNGGIITVGSIFTANAGDFITQPSTGANATILYSVVDAISVGVQFTENVFTTGSGWLSINSANIAAYPTSLNIVVVPNNLSANVGQYITQPSTGANARIIQQQVGGTIVNVSFVTANVFTVGSGNIQLAGTNIAMYPTSVVTQTDVAIYYTNNRVFEFNTSSNASLCYINGVNTYATPIQVNSVGIDTGSTSIQGNIGFDQGKFDQGVLNLPPGITINSETGWITGYLPTQTINEINYTFGAIVYKRDYSSYTTNTQFNLRVLGDINNTIEWLTLSNLGTIQNGAISDFIVKAISTKGKTLYYNYAENSHIRLPQGLELLSNGMITGRVSFTVFSLDVNQTTIDSGTTTFDNTYKFSVTASNYENTISATKEFIIRVLQRNAIPYENLYLKAFLSREQRIEFNNILRDTSVFPAELIYRSEDPNFGLAKDIKTLFIAGLAPNLISRYAEAVATNHYIKRINFADIKTAVAVDYNVFDVIETASQLIIGTFKEGVGFIPTNFDLGYTPANVLPAGTSLSKEHIKYEVVYADIIDENSYANSAGRFGPPDTIDLSNRIATPYYDVEGNSFTVAYPNSFENMNDVMVNSLGYLDKGVLPEWMISRQPNGLVLGFTRAVVLAYTVEGASKKLAYRYQKAGYNLNALDFTIDRYQLDNNYTTNYSIVTGTFIRSDETTFDHYPGLNDVFTSAGNIDYAVQTSFENINKHTVSDIINQGGLDGVVNFSDGDTLVFFQQEYQSGIAIGELYNLGWSNVASTWGVDLWDNDSGTPGNIGSVTSDDIGWDEATYVPGYNENLLDSNIVNERAGIWKININADNIVLLTFVQSVDYYSSLYVRNGFTHSSTKIYYDPIIKAGYTVPSYSEIPQQINIVATTFDGNGTKFLNYRDSYTVPEQGDKYIKFTKTGVFT